MYNPNMLSIYVTSPNKRQGKTFVSAGIAATMQSLGYSTGVYKPIQTSGKEINGFMQSPDLTFLKKIDPYITTHFSYLYKDDTEPLIASESENETIDIDYINNEYKRMASGLEYTVIDGDSGFFSPIAPNTLTADILRKLSVPLLIATPPDENAVNNTLLTINAATEKNIEIRGVIINNITKDCPKKHLASIPRIIEEFSNVKVLGLIPKLQDKFSPEDLITAILNGVDIESVFNVKIEKLDIN